MTTGSSDDTAKMSPPPSFRALELHELMQENPDMLLADGFEEAFIGVCRRFGQPPLAAYDRAKCISILARVMTEEEAEEFFDFNVIGAWMGEHTPVFLDLKRSIQSYNHEDKEP